MYLYVSYAFGGWGGGGATRELLCHGGPVPYGVLPSLAGRQLPAAVICTVYSDRWSVPAALIWAAHLRAFGNSIVFAWEAVANIYDSSSLGAEMGNDNGMGKIERQPAQSTTNTWQPTTFIQEPTTATDRHYQKLTSTPDNRPPTESWQKNRRPGRKQKPSPEHLFTILLQT